MRKLVGAVVVVSAPLVASACVGTTPRPELTPLAEAVVVYDDVAGLPSTCRMLKEVVVTDGNVDYGHGLVYDGSYERALIRLKNRVGSERGDAVLIIHDDAQWVCVDCDEGSVVRIRGQVLRCDRDGRSKSALAGQRERSTDSERKEVER
jgi:hypothetical protein